MIAFVVTLFATPLCRRLAMRTGALVVPAARSMHSQPVPHLGGVAIGAGVIAALVTMATGGELPVAVVVVGGLLILVLGVIDDFRPLCPRTKLLGQLVAALVLVVGGVRVSFLSNPFGDMIIIGYWGIPLSIAWVVALTNVVNLSDGLDGLAAGIVSIASLTLLYVAWHQGQPHIVVATAAVAGGALGFLPHNFNPARIFMGDAGSMFLGYILAAISIQGAFKGAAAVTLVVPVLALGLPMIDFLFAVLRRAANGKPIYEADAGHLHHRLLRLGLSQRQAVVLLYVVSMVFGATAMLMTALNLRQSGMLLVVLVGAVVGAGKKAGILELRQEKTLRH
jgi:UDP-GlcNAc:undecaprenyl-phosphate GlcNAc-1-phosphate transferase